MNIFDYLRSIYKKTKIDFNGNLGDSIVISRYLSYDENNLKELKPLLKYLFYIDPIHYYYLLFFNISKKYMPYIRPFKKQKGRKEDMIMNKLKEYFKWRERDMEVNNIILKDLVKKERKKLKIFFGIK